MSNAQKLSQVVAGGITPPLGIEQLVGFTIEGGSTSKTLTVDDALTTSNALRVTNIGSIVQGYNVALTNLASYMTGTGNIGIIKKTAANTYTVDTSSYSLSSHNHSGVYEPAITAGTTAQYWRGDKSWQTLNATTVGLGNVTNESKATMFSSPTFSGTVGGITAAMVGAPAGSGTSSGTNTGDQTAATVANTPAGSIAATTVQAAINELDTEKAALAGSASQAFSVAAATAADHATRKDQIGVANSALVATALNAAGSAPIYACRAWVNFNGTGTVAIRASGNVSSITDNGTGDYTVNFTTAMSDANYCVLGSTQGGGVAILPVISPNQNNTQTTSAVPVYTTSASVGTPTDFVSVGISIFR